MLILLFICLLSRPSFAILPLPYSMERPEVEVEDEDLWDPKSVLAYKELYQDGQLREMELPAFGEQPKATGYETAKTFQVPPDLKDRVDFWKKVYSEYTSNQAILHDANHTDIIYKVIDISDIMGQDIPYRKKMKLLNHRFKDEKAKISAELKEMDEGTLDPVRVPVEELPVFQKISALNEGEPHKFVAASKRIRAQVGQRDRIVKGFLYGGRYFAKLMEVFEKKGVPKELSRLALVESGFDLSARSKVGASGVFQFMRTTGKKFLRIDRAVDERNDPISAAWAAAELLRQNYEALGSWPLAITAYNHGREGIAKAVRKVASNNLNDIIKNYHGRTFGFASANFYSEFLAILQLEQEYRTHFGKLLVDTPIDYEEFLVPDNVKFEKLAIACDVQTHFLVSLNPALTDWVISGRGYVPLGYHLRIPAGKGSHCQENYKKMAKTASKVKIASLRPRKSL